MWYCVTHIYMLQIHYTVNLQQLIVQWLYVHETCNDLGVEGLEPSQSKDQRIFCLLQLSLQPC
jgi:hypothetical protein